MVNSRRYEVILLDCFNTILLPDLTTLPVTIVDGKPTPSTAGMLAEELRPYLPAVEAEQIYHAHREAWRWAETNRGPDVREVPAIDRFRHMLVLLGMAKPEDGLAARILERHSNLVADSYEFSDAYREILSRLARSHRLALFSNFDYGPALRRKLERHGLDRILDPIVISAEIGYRKPGRIAFDLALEALRKPREAILFVGDSLIDDVAGAAAAGLPVAWINPEGDTPASGPPPDHLIRNLAELEALLRG